MRPCGTSGAARTVPGCLRLFAAGTDPSGRRPKGGRVDDGLRPDRDRFVRASCGSSPAVRRQERRLTQCSRRFRHRVAIACAQGYCAGRNRCATSRRRGRSNTRNFACRCDCHIARSGANHSDRFTQTRHPDRGRRGFDPAAGRGTRNPYQFPPIRDACCTITAGSATPRWPDRVVLATERDIRPLSVLDPLSRPQSQHILEFNRRHARIIVSTSQ